MAAYYAALRIIQRRRKRRLTSTRILSDLQNPFCFEEDVFKDKFCFDQKCVHYLCELLGPIMRRSQGYPVELQVLTSLQVLRSASFQHSVGEDQVLKLSQATVSRSLDAFLEAIEDIVPRLIEFPSPSDFAFTEPKFYGQSKIQNIIGVLDCFHVLIHKPHGLDSNVYLNSEGQYSIKVQLVCDSDLTILDAVVDRLNTPGSIPNCRIWKESLVRNILKSNTMGNRNFLIGNSSFPLEPWLLVPYEDCQKTEELIFNDHLNRALNTAQICVTALRTRFKCLNFRSARLFYAPEKWCRIIMACVVLHNISVKLNVTLDEVLDLNDGVYFVPPEYSDVDSDIEENMLRNEAMTIRDDVSKQLCTV